MGSILHKETVTMLPPCYSHIKELLTGLCKAVKYEGIVTNMLPKYESPLIVIFDLSIY
jgi:hypothetical protein